MSPRLITAASAALLLWATSPSLAKPPCNSAAEVNAMQFRQLQIELMVASLKCDGTGYDYRGQYSAYMQKMGSALSENARQLRAMFARQGKGASYMDRYLTSMSNEAQLRSAAVDNYCESRAATLDRVALLGPHELHAFAAETVGLPYEAESCPIPTRKASVSKKPSKKAPATTLSKS